MLSNDPLNFDVSDDADRQAPTIPITISGVYRMGAKGQDGSKKWTEHFEVSALLPLSAGFAMRDAFLEDDGTGARGVNPAAVITFLRGAIADEEGKRRFMALVNDNDRLVKLEVLAKIMTTIVERQTGRPTGEVSPS